MTMLYSDKLEHIFYIKSKDELKNSCYFLIGNDYYIIKLYTDKISILDIDMPIKNRDRRMLETLGYWLNDSTLNLDNIYMYIRLKAIKDRDFFHWWQKFNFSIKIERKFDYI